MKQKLKEWLFVVAVFAGIGCLFVLIILDVLARLGFRWGCL